MRGAGRGGRLRHPGGCRPGGRWPTCEGRTSALLGAVRTATGADEGHRKKQDEGKDQCRQGGCDRDRGVAMTELVDGNLQVVAAEQRGDGELAENEGDGEEGGREHRGPHIG